MAVSQSLAGIVAKAADSGMTLQDDAAKREVTERQRRIVDYMASTGCNVPTAAKSLKINAANIYRELRKPHVIRYIHESIANHLGSSALRAIGTLDKLLDARSELVRLQAATDLLDRAGFKAPDRKVIQGEVSIRIDLG